MSADVRRLAADANTAANDAVAAAELAKRLADEAARERQRVEEMTPPTVHEQVVAELASLEGGALLRLGPRRNRWRDLQRFDDQLAEIERERERLTRELDGLREARNNEPDRHAVALANWFENREGDRPEPGTSALDERTADLQAEHAALGVRYNRLLGERVEHVRRCRKAMLRDVGTAKDEVAREYAALVDQLEAKRQELLDLRQAEVWCALFPNGVLTGEPNTQALVGAKKRLQAPVLPGLESGLVASSVFNLIRADGNFCATVATVEQAAAERGVSVGELTGRDARWEDGSGKADFVGPRFAATWGATTEEKQEAERIAAYTEANRKRVWGE